MHYLYVDGMRSDVIDLHLVQRGQRTRRSPIKRFRITVEQVNGFINNCFACFFLVSSLIANLLVIRNIYDDHSIEKNLSPCL